MSERVRQALLRPDICHRESEFSDMLLRIQQKLLTAFVPGAESEYVAVVLTGVRHGCGGICRHVLPARWASACWCSTTGSTGSACPI